MWFNVYILAPSLYRLTVLLETDIIMSGFEHIIIPRLRSDHFVLGSTAYVVSK